MKLITATFALAIAALIGAMQIAEAKSYRASGRTHGFATSRCKTSSCYSKHPGGTWVHPITSRKRR